MPPKSSRPPKNLSAKEIFGARLLEARTRLGISQEQLAADAGVHRTYVSQVESGKRNIAVDNMERLAAAVGIPLWEMLKS